MDKKRREAVVGKRVAGTTMGIGVIDPENPSQYHRPGDERHNDTLACLIVKVRGTLYCFTSCSLAPEGPNA